MDILSLFLTFLESILSFEILGVSLYIYLITITVITLVIQMLKNLAGGKK